MSLFDATPQPLHVNAFLQALGSAERQKDVDHLRARFEQYKGGLNGDDIQSIERALERQEAVIAAAVKRAMEEES